MKYFDFKNADLEDKISKLRKKTASLSFLRLLTFLGLIGFFVLMIAESMIWGLVWIGFIILFIHLIKSYNFWKDQEAIYKALDQINQNENLRQERKLESLDPGIEYLDKKHPFCNDLDLFGSHSVFQLLNHTVSPEAKNQLANLLKSPIAIEESEQNRKAIDELAESPDFLKAFEAVGKAFFNSDVKHHQWEEWLKSEDKRVPWSLFVGCLGLLGGIILGVLVYISLVPSAFLGVWVLIGMALLGFVFKPLQLAAEKIPSQSTLKTFKNWLVLLENQRFESSALLRDLEVFQDKNHRASEVLKELDSLGLWVQNRINILYIPINLFFWTDLLLYYKMVKWKARFGKLVSKYPHILSKWEVWVSLASFRSELEADGEVFIKNGLELETTALYHPLLPKGKAVANDFSISEKQKLSLLTGSNMSGKTTFMRTLGVNIVLVNIGLRPFAEKMELGQFQLYTSMRNTDSLGESVSSFYAELNRIKTLIDLIESGVPVFFLLDEILKGTNTEDRIAGSEALIRQLKDSKALGIISTHDIELAALEDQIPYVKNYSFHSEIHNRSIDFDYKLKKGPCTSFNAHKLMELMGIKFHKR